MARSLQEQINDLRATTEANFRSVANHLRSTTRRSRAQEFRDTMARLEPRPLTSPSGTFQGNQPEFPGSAPSGMSTMDRLRRDQFMPDYSGEAGSVVDPGSGVLVHAGNTDPTQGGVGAQPFLYNEWKRLIRNGDFHDPPPDPTLPIDNTTNPLPGWNADAPDGAGTNSLYWVADPTSGSGGKVESRSTSSGVRGRLSQLVPVRSSTTRNNSVALVLSGYGSGATPVADIYVDGMNSAGVELINPVINVSVALLVGTVSDVTSVGTASLDAATQELLVRIDLRRSSGTGTITATEVQLVESTPITVWGDLSNPANNPATAKYDAGVWTLNADGVAVSGGASFVATDAIWDAKGDLAAATGADAAAKLTVGANNTLLVPDSSVANGLKWVTTLPTAATAALTGDVTKSAGSNATTLVSGTGATLTNTTLTGTVQFVSAANTSTGSTVDVPFTTPRMRWNGASAATFHGIVAEGSGSAHTITNVTAAQNLTLAHQSGTEATAANRIICPNAADLILAPGAGVGILYDNASSRWFVTEPNTPAYTGDVTSSAGGTVNTLAAGNAGNLNSGTLLAARMPAHTGDVTSSAGSVALTLAAGNAGNLNSGTLLAARMPALTGDVTTSAGAVATTIAAGAVTLAKQANLAANSIQGNNTGSPATPLALTAAQVRTLLALVIGTNVQAWDADLDTLAAATVTSGGTFTPALAWATVGSSTWATTTAVGFYTRFLDRILFNFLYVGTPTIGTGSGNLVLSGLPVTSNATANTGTKFEVEIGPFTSAGSFVNGSVQANATTAIFRASTSGSGTQPTTLAVANFTTAAALRIQGAGQYQI